MKQFIKFSMVGGLNTAITVITFNILKFLGMNIFYANIAGYAVGTINSYIWNKNWVFTSKEKHRDLIFKFIAVNLVTLSFNNLIMYGLVYKLFVNESVSQLIATGFGIIINYVLNKIWTFKGVK